MGMLNLADAHRRTIPAPKNPMDMCTIVSIYPKEIRSIKPTIQPGYFHILAGSPASPKILVVGSSSWWRDIDIDQPLLEIPNSSIQVADSIVKDYCNGLLAASVPDIMPGLFFVNGEHSLKDIQDKYKKELAAAEARQKRWYEALVRLADVGWSRTNGNPLTISDNMRDAAKELGLKDKEWMRDFQSMEMVACIACGARRSPAYPICGSCKAIVDPIKAKELGLTFAN